MIISRIVTAFVFTYGVQKLSEVAADNAVKQYIKLGGIDGIKTKIQAVKDYFDSSKNADLAFEDIKKCLKEMKEQMSTEDRIWTEQEIRDYVQGKVKPRYINDVDTITLNVRVNLLMFTLGIDK
jgi:hypothetical protein